MRMATAVGVCTSVVCGSVILVRACTYLTLYFDFYDDFVEMWVELAVIKGVRPRLIGGVVKIALYHPTDRLSFRGHSRVTGNKVFLLSGLTEVS